MADFGPNDTAELTVNLEPYTLTDDSACGDLVYEYSDTNSNNPGVNEFASGGKATAVGPTITYTDLKNMPTGSISVLYKVR